MFSVLAGSRGITRLDFKLVSRKLKTRHPIPPQLVQLQRKLNQYLKGKPVSFTDIPLDISKAPAFYRKVWQETRKIPWGKIQTYRGLAERVRARKASRAIGNAMKQNPFPILIPCHRIIRSNRTLGGYSKGIALKRYLLALEGVTMIPVKGKRVLVDNRL